MDLADDSISNVLQQSKEQQTHNASTFMLSRLMKFGIGNINVMSKQSTFMPRQLYFCHSYIQVPVLLSLFYTSACTFVGIFIDRENILLCLHDAIRRQEARPFLILIPQTLIHTDQQGHL